MRFSVMVSSARGYTTWVTSAGRPVDHAVADDAMASALSSPDGVFVAVCGIRFLPASMAAAPGSVCGSCRLFLEAWAPMRTGLTRHRVRRRGWFSRLKAALFDTAVPASGPACSGMTISNMSTWREPGGLVEDVHRADPGWTEDGVLDGPR